MQSINPATEKLIKTFTPDTFSDVSRKLSDLQRHFLQWKATTLEQRIHLINKVADILLTDKLAYAQIMTDEMGKLKSQAIQEIEKCALACQYYITHTKDFLAKKTIQTEAKQSYVVYEPLGIILGIMPWNFPFWQVIRFAIPTLAAGNVIMLKHSSSVSGCAVALEELFCRAAEDLHLEIFKTILIDSKEVNQVIEHPLVQAVSLTGSVTAGKSVAGIAGNQIKKTVLELGGSDPYIVLADADIDLAVTACAKSRLNNSGQSCIAAKRFIVVAAIYDEFLAKLTAYFAKLKVGDPNIDDTDIGPLANKQIFDTVLDQIQTTIAAGATCHFGGERLMDVGYYLQPTILTNIPPDSPAYSDEIFGPVASVFKVANEEEALLLANHTTFGLGAAIFTRDLNRAAMIAEKHLNAGMVFVNAHVVSDPRLPFGGVKHSGFGRELSEFGIHEFVNIKTISIRA